MTMTPPAHSLSSVVLPESRARAGAILARRLGLSSIIAARRCLLQRSAMSRVGWTIIIGAFWVSMNQPTQLLPISVPADCTDFMKTTRLAGCSADRHSMIPAA